MTEGRDPGREFDHKMARYLSGLRQTWTNRRGFLKLAAGSAGAATLTPHSADQPRQWGMRFLPGLSAVQVEDDTFTFGLEGDVRGLEPALSYDFTANPVVCQISEGLLIFDAEGGLQPLLAEKWDHPDELTYIYTLRDGIIFSRRLAGNCRRCHRVDCPGPRPGGSWPAGLDVRRP